MTEAFKPIAVRPPEDNRALFWARCLVDLQLWTIVHFLREPLGAVRGKVLDVGAGQAPWRGMLAKEVDYTGVDVEKADEFGMLRVPGVVYYDGSKLPMADDSFDALMCIEVLEHVPDPAALLADMWRVLKPGGQLILTVPWSARIHHIPHDYSRFTRFGLARRLATAGFVAPEIRERGNDIAAIANKLIILTLRLVRPKPATRALWSLPLALLLAPATLGFVFAAHVALRCGLGSREDPLGYGVIAFKPKPSA
ncbi:class I SAM-dependent methyltransferase [Azorhizobium doebereinerae]|uniref:class I SAM-dependent methyltransferase n=1 Tax=Azorhizobium doebereinerae TaxID=281091 RepID=UPI000427CDDC|nr:class I SAM-dependent methyltransferase [Azorhizobium doebereinerae]